MSSDADSVALLPHAGRSSAQWWTALGALALANALWGLCFLLGKIALEDFAPAVAVRT